MILKWFLQVIISFVFFIFGLITSIMPSSNIDITSLISSVMSLCSQALNCLNFLFGDWFYGFYTLLVFFLPFKFISVPLFSFVRGFIKFGSD